MSMVDNIVMMDKTMVSYHTTNREAVKTVDQEGLARP
jgi:hypothetical protein